MNYFAYMIVLASSFALGVTGASLLAQADSPIDWSEQLEALQPTQPMEYFLLGEDVADAGETTLARRLFALSAILGTGQLRHSALLALVAIEDDAQQRRRLAALAALLAADGAEPVAIGSPLDDAAHDPASVHVLGEAFSFFRRGTGTRALRHLERTSTLDLLHSVGHALPSGSQGFIERARGMRGTGAARISDSQLVEMLQVELALLAGNERSWSADLVLYESTPLIEIDPERLDEALDVDASRTRYRDGQWVR